MKTTEQVLAAWKNANAYNTPKDVFELLQALRHSTQKQSVLKIDLGETSHMMHETFEHNEDLKRDLKLAKENLFMTQNAAIDLNNRLTIAREALVRLQHESEASAQGVIKDALDKI